MAESICDTSPLQYLHQLRLLHVLRELFGGIIIPPAVVEELAEGKRRGIDLPDIGVLDWVSVREPRSIAALPLASNLGAGEAEVLMLALESDDAIVIIDDLLARGTASALDVQVKGTLGILLDAKRRGLIEAVKPHLDRLQELNFRLAPQTRVAVLDLADEGE
ncbi:MAG: putative nucleic acid-binding protein [Kiritimatiellia bacterium]